MTNPPNLEILVLLRPDLYRLLFPPETERALRALGHVVLQGQEHDLTSEELAARIAGFDAVVTGWGTPRFTGEVLAAADRLRLIAHSAGSVKGLLPPAVFERGIAVTHAASAIAPAVAEASLMCCLLLLHQAYKRDRALRAGDWESAREPGLGQELGGQRVGVIGAGYTGRCFIKLLRALEAEVWVHDPYLSDERAAELGVHKVTLDDVLAQCRIVSLQAPATEETRHLIGARELSLLQDGAILINTARAWLVDSEALVAELKTGRIQAALDVFDQEPLPEDNPFRGLHNVFMTPHTAGSTAQARCRQGQAVVGEIRRFFSGQPLRWQITVEMLETMA